MSATGEPMQRGSEAVPPRCGIVRASLSSGDPELPVVLPPLPTKDRPEVAVVRLVAFVQPDRAVVEVDPDSLGKEVPPFEFPQHRGMDRRSPLGSLERGREAGGRAEEAGMIQNRTKGRDGIVPCAADPSCRRRFKHTVSGLDPVKQFRGGRSFTALRGDENHFRKDSLRMEAVGPFLRIQGVRERQQQRITSRPLRGMGFGKFHPQIHPVNVESFRHTRPVTGGADFSNH